MPLNRPALSLGPGPRGVQDARRWVVDVCADIGRAELVECAELGVSELVTNALLHGRAADHGAGARHPRAPARRGARRLARAARCCPTLSLRRRATTTCSSPSGAASRSWPAARAPGAPTSRTTARSSGSCPPPSPPTTPRRRRHHRPRRDAEAAAAAGDRRSSRSSCTTCPLRPSSASRRTTASCAARCGCWRWRTRTTTRWPRACPTSSARWTAQLREGIGADQIDAAAAAAGANRPTSRARSPRDGAATVGRFLELLDLADAFCRNERLLSLARTRRAGRVPALVLRGVRPPGRGRRPAAVARPSHAATLSRAQP